MALEWLFGVGFAVVKVALRANDEADLADMVDDVHAGTTGLFSKLRELQGSPTRQQTLGRRIDKEIRNEVIRELGENPPDDAEMQGAVTTATAAITRTIDSPDALLEALRHPDDLASWMAKQAAGLRRSDVAELAERLFDRLIAAAAGRIVELAPTSKRTLSTGMRVALDQLDRIETDASTAATNSARAATNSARAVELLESGTQLGTPSSGFLTAGPSKSAPRVRDVTASEAGVHRSTVNDLGYVERDLHESAVAVLHQHRKLLILGPSMAGKTRLALAVIQQSHPDWVWHRPADGGVLHQEITAGVTFDETLIWLDDLQDFTAAGLTDHDLETLLRTNDSVVVVATLGNAFWEGLQPTDGLHPPGWKVCTWFGDPVHLIPRCSEAEVQRLKTAPGGAAIEGRVRQYGLGGVLGGAPLVENRLSASVQHPDAYAVIQAVVDWRRARMLSPLSFDALVELLPAYLQPQQMRTYEQRAREGLDWSLTKISDTVALIVDDEGFRAEDLLLDLFDKVPIEDGVWPVLQERADGHDGQGVGYAAHAAGRDDIAAAIWTKAADAGNLRAAFNLGVMRMHEGRRDEARQRWRQVVDGDEPFAPPSLVGAAMNWLGELAESEPEPDWEAAIDWYRRSADLGDPNSMARLGDIAGSGPAEYRDLEEAKRRYSAAADLGHPAAMVRLASLLASSPDSAADDLVARALLENALPKLTPDDQLWAGAMGQLGNVVVALEGPGSARGVECWTQAAAAGDARSMVNLGSLAMAGSPPDVATARKHYEDAARARNLDGMARLGAILINSGDPTEFAEGVELLQKASTGGLDYATTLLHDRLHGS